MNQEDAIGVLRKRWEYDLSRQQQLDVLCAWLDQSTLRDDVSSALMAAGTIARDGQYAGLREAFMGAIVAGLERGSDAIQMEAIELFDAWWSATNAKEATASLAALMSHAEPIAEAAAHRLWTHRRRGTMVPTCEAIWGALDHPSTRARFFVALTLAFDASDEEREELVRTARTNRVPKGFGDTSDAYFPGWFRCRRSASKWPNESDPSPAKYAPSSCRACGSARTDPRYHDLVLYSIGIIETLEVQCRVCRFYTVVNFET